MSPYQRSLNGPISIMFGLMLGNGNMNLPDAILDLPLFQQSGKWQGGGYQFRTLRSDTYQYHKKMKTVNTGGVSTLWSVVCYPSSVVILFCGSGLSRPPAEQGEAARGTSGRK